MPEFNLSFLVTAFAFVVYVLIHFNRDLDLPKWLAPFSLGGMLSVLVMLLPWMGKGSFLAFAIAYLVLGVLLINWLVLFSVAHLPGKPVVQLSTNNTRSGMILLRLMGAGLVVLLKGLFNALAWAMIQMMTMVVWAWAACQGTSERQPQKLLKSAIAWG